jgi:DNA helicase-2/ATP-dependent DNA helicase PcrA
MEDAISSLTQTQLEAVNWNDGSLLVLAGPGSGKTRVLTTRIARLLTESPQKSFRVLALTFTIKAADEMKDRVLALVPSMERRLFIGTFHGFCMQLLQQHGSHIGLQPDFTIYSHDDDRRQALVDGLRRVGRPTGDAQALSRYLSLIDKLKARLFPVEGSRQRFKDKEQGKLLEEVYGAYEAELNRVNALDFGSLIQRSFELIKAVPSVAKQYRTTYKYWLLDEYQDTNLGQYTFLRTLAGDDFKNVFAVADDDQILYQWNGASYQQIVKFQNDFNPGLIQLPTNYRCPASIVACANRLVVNNRERTAAKLPLETGKLKTLLPKKEHIRSFHYATDEDEAKGVAKDLLERGRKIWSACAVLGRTRAILEKVVKACQEEGVSAIISQRRDQFKSPEYQWLHAALRLTSHPLDKRCFALFVSMFNRLAACQLQSDLLIADSEATEQSFLRRWREGLANLANPYAERLADMALSLSTEPAAFRKHIEDIRKLFVTVQPPDEEAVDFAEDDAAWKELVRQIAQSLGSAPTLDQFLQELSMRSKEPPLQPDTVQLMTVHGAKGKEFDYVYVVGLAEEIMPSFQSLRAGEQSPEMEEERRNCFVAITRAKESLTLTWADRYRGYAKKPSRYLGEMGLGKADNIGPTPHD